jgi:hypothetical protein
VRPDIREGREGEKIKKGGIGKLVRSLGFTSCLPCIHFPRNC